MAKTKRKRLLILTNRFLPQVGGAEYYIRGVAQGLAEYFDVDVVTPRRDNVPTYEEVDGYRIFRLYDCMNPLNRFPYLGATTLCPSLVPRMLFNTYDAVHCFPALNYNNFLALIAGQWKKMPVFLTCFDAFDYLGLFASGQYTPETIDQLAVSSRRKGWLSRFRAIFTIAQRETDMLREANPNTFLSPVPVSVEEFQQPAAPEAFREAFHIREGRKIILCLSRVSYIKGQDLLLKAVPLLKEKRSDFTVAFVGSHDHEPDYFEEMRKFTVEHDLQEQVFFTGIVSRELVLSALNACDVHVLPMRFMNAGTINSETWAVGKPVLQSSRVDPNYIREGVDGMTFDVDKPESLVEKLDYLLSNPEDCQRMGEAGKARVAAEFSTQYLVSRYLDLYERYGQVKP